jgi:3',5'-cyclic AMP phosphodiesterase CpdA
VSEVIVAHFSDIHFGGRADLRQLATLEEYLPALKPGLIVVSGDLTQRARHGEFQAAARYLEGLRRTAPVHVILGNHDVQWWRSPFGIFGRRPLYGKWRHYFGEDLGPVLELDHVVAAGMCSAYGVAFGSLTANPNDMAVRGHLPHEEVRRVRAVFARVPPGKLRIAVLHHNVLPGVISRRWGLARPHTAQAGLLSLGADVVLCGHDHTEGAGQIDGRLAVSTAGTHSTRTRGGRPGAFNLIRIDERQIHIEHHVYRREERTFRRGQTATFPRTRDAAGSVAR